MRFNGKTVIVTGAASGIGRAVAERFAREGARVMMGDVNTAGLAEVKATLGETASAHALDVTNPAHCAAIVREALAKSGRLDIVCNVAGVLRMAPVAAITPDEWNRIVGINLGGTFYMCQAALPSLVETRGCIVNLASSAGLVGVPFNAPYVASKHGVVGLTRALALEFANAGVRINAVCPTGVKTPMVATPLGKDVDPVLLAKSAPWLNGGEFCDPPDIADAVAFLASDEARRITGIALPVDGGQTAN